MKTHYYCKKCDVFFLEEEKPPNMNRVHYVCGSRVIIVSHVSESEIEGK